MDMRTIFKLVNEHFLTAVSVTDIHTDSKFNKNATIIEVGGDTDGTMTLDANELSLVGYEENGDTRYEDIALETPQAIFLRNFIDFKAKFNDPNYNLHDRVESIFELFRNNWFLKVDFNEIETENDGAVFRLAIDQKNHHLIFRTEGINYVVKKENFKRIKETFDAMFQTEKKGSRCMNDKKIKEFIKHEITENMTDEQKVKWLRNVIKTHLFHHMTGCGGHFFATFDENYVLRFMGNNRISLLTTPVDGIFERIINLAVTKNQYQYLFRLAKKNKMPDEYVDLLFTAGTNEASKKIFELNKGKKEDE